MLNGVSTLKRRVDCNNASVAELCWLTLHSQDASRESKGGVAEGCLYPAGVSKGDWSCRDTSAVCDWQMPQGNNGLITCSHILHSYHPHACLHPQS